MKVCKNLLVKKYSFQSLFLFFSFGEYNSLDDYYLQGYFTNKQLRKQLRKAGLVSLSVDFLWKLKIFFWYIILKKMKMYVFVCLYLCVFSFELNFVYLTNSLINMLLFQKYWKKFENQETILTKFKLLITDG